MRSTAARQGLRVTKIGRLDALGSRAKPLAPQADDASNGRLRQFTALTDALELADLIENLDVVDVAPGEVVDGGSALRAPHAVATSVVDGERCQPQGKHTEGDEKQRRFGKHGWSM
jgi:hypothetical protein